MKSHKNFLKLMALGSLSLAVVACDQNPFPTDEGRLLPVENKPEPVLPPFSIEVAPVLLCTEGEECSTPVIGRVPNNGKPIFEFEGLPEGASFVESKGLLSFKPGYNTVDLSADATQTSKTFVSTIVLRSDRGAVAAYRKQILIHVKNVLRPLTFQLENNNPQVLEGQTFAQVLTVRSDDFPNGPFYLNIPNQPAGFSFNPVAGNPKQFQIRYTPGASFVTPRDTLENGRYLKRFAMDVVISTPQGPGSTQTMNWTVLDHRMSPNVSAPALVRQAGASINFMIRAEDPNGERAPSVVVNTNVPFGRMSVEKLSDAPGVPGVTLPSSLYNVRWDQIPLDQVGQTHTVFSLVCGPSSLDANSICVNAQTRIEIAPSSIPTTDLDRKAWQSSQIRFVKAGSFESFPLEFQDRRLSVNDVDFEMTPKSLSKYVSVQGGKLHVKFDDVGVHHFQVKMKQDGRLLGTESFVLEVMPREWSEAAIQNEILARVKAFEETRSAE